MGSSLQSVWPKAFLFLFFLPWVLAEAAYADYFSSVLADNPLAYWRLNETQTDVAINSSTNGDAYDGTYVGVKGGPAGPSELGDGTPLSGFASSNVAYDMGGSEEHMFVDSQLLSGLSEFTMTGWFWIRGLEEERTGLFGQNDAVEFGFVATDQLHLWTANGGSMTWQFDPSTDVPDFEWFHVAAVGTGDDLQLYLNGALVGTGGTPTSGDYGSSAFPFRVGGGGIFDASGNNFRGILDEVAVWDMALSPDQIAGHFAAAIGNVLPGDFDGDGQIDIDDVNLLQRAIYDGSTDVLYDVDDNEVIDDDDLAFWVGDIAISWFGDADLDGNFSSADLVTVLAGGEYEDTGVENSTWETGDWNADLEFDSRDLVTALADGGYEVTRPRPLMVPEPSGGWVSWLVVAYVLTSRRGRI